MKVIIIDDDKTSVEVLADLLKNYDEIELAGVADNGTQGIALVKKTQPDLLFLDVEMPDMSGLEFLSKMGDITQKKCQVVIYTAYSRYMLPAFRGKAFDFLLKPADTRELQQIIQRFLIEYDNDSNRIVPTELSNKLLLYVNTNDFRVANINDIGLFQYNHELRLWEAFVIGHKENIRLKRATNNESLLALDKRFVQVNQGHIINIDYLMEVTDGVCRFYPPFDRNDQVKVGRTFRKKLTERFNAL